MKKRCNEYITSIVVRGLFDRMHWKLKLKNGLQIYTGPNSCGKSTILKTIYNLRNGINSNIKASVFSVKFSDKSKYSIKSINDEIDFSKSITLIRPEDFDRKNLIVIEHRIASMYNNYTYDPDIIYELPYAYKGMDDAKKIEIFDKFVKKMYYHKAYYKDDEKLAIYNTIEEGRGFYEFINIVNDMFERKHMDWKISYSEYSKEIFLKQMNYKDDLTAVGLPPSFSAIHLKNLSYGELNLIMLYYNTIFHGNHGNKIVLIDTPELGIDEESQLEFMRWLKTMCDERHWQAIVATQSRAILSEFSNCMAKDELE